MILDLLADVVQLYLICLFLRIILTWVHINPWSKMARVEALLIRITEPVLVPARRMLPTMRVGQMGLDLSPILVFVGLEILISVLRNH